MRNPCPPARFYDWDFDVGALAAEEPFWEPGTRHGYHGLTFGFLVGEVVRRVSGKPLGDFFADEIAGPLGLDLDRPARIRARPGRDADAARAARPGTRSPLLVAGHHRPDVDPGLVLVQQRRLPRPGEWDSPAALSRGDRASGGVINAWRSPASTERSAHERHDVASA